MLKLSKKIIFNIKELLRDFQRTYLAFYAYTAPFGLRKRKIILFCSWNSMTELEPLQITIIPNYITQYKRQFTDKFNKTEQWVNILKYILRHYYLRMVVFLLTEDYTKNCHLNYCKMSCCF